MPCRDRAQLSDIKFRIIHKKFWGCDSQADFCCNYFPPGVSLLVLVTYVQSNKVTQQRITTPFFFSPSFVNWGSCILSSNKFSFGTFSLGCVWEVDVQILISLVVCGLLFQGLKFGIKVVKAENTRALVMLLNTDESLGLKCTQTGKLLLILNIGSSNFIVCLCVWDDGGGVAGNMAPFLLFLEPKVKKIGQGGGTSKGGQIPG